MVRLGKRQWIDDPLLGHGEHDGGTGNAEGDGEQRHRDKSRAARERAEGIADVERQVFEWRQTLLLAIALPRGLHAAQPRQGHSPRFFRQQAAAEVVGDVHVEMRGQFLFEIGLAAEAQRSGQAKQKRTERSDRHGWAFPMGSPIRRLSQLLWECN